MSEPKILRATDVKTRTNEGEITMTSGTCAGFKAGERNGHHLVNRSRRPALLASRRGTASRRLVLDHPAIVDCNIGALAPTVRKESGCREGMGAMAFKNKEQHR